MLSYRSVIIVSHFFVFATVFSKKVVDITNFFRFLLFGFRGIIRLMLGTFFFFAKNYHLISVILLGSGVSGLELMTTLMLSSVFTKVSLEGVLLISSAYTSDS